MDRDNRWERVKFAYDVLVNAKGKSATSALGAIDESYKENITDEFILPTVIVDDKGSPLSSIQEGDAVLCFNFRTDRCREITRVLTQTDFPEFGMHTLRLHYTTMAEYDASFSEVNVIFNTDDLKNTLGAVMEQNGLRQLRVAETEKYPHVTFFFSGGREKSFEGEERIMIPSPKVATYDLKPEMSAVEITDSMVEAINRAEVDFVCLNYANADMVGHTGVWDAAIKAVETVDTCVARVVTAALEKGYTVFLTADHGNADYLVNEDGTPNTAHTLNLVPLFIIDRTWNGVLKQGKLGDIAPTILTMMGLPIPLEMTGNVLVSTS
jgi:2,3-bisphosphoglycerate-independent phosphoglycerate mutase